MFVEDRKELVAFNTLIAGVDTVDARIPSCRIHAAVQYYLEWTAIRKGPISEIVVDRARHYETKLVGNSAKTTATPIYRLRCFIDREYTEDPMLSDEVLKQLVAILRQQLSHQCSGAPMSVRPKFVKVESGPVMLTTTDR